MSKVEVTFRYIYDRPTLRQKHDVASDTLSRVLKYLGMHINYDSNKDTDLQDINWVILLAE